MPSQRVFCLVRGGGPGMEGGESGGEGGETCFGCVIGRR